MISFKYRQFECNGIRLQMGTGTIAERETAAYKHIRILQDIAGQREQSDNHQVISGVEWQGKKIMVYLTDGIAFKVTQMWIGRDADQIRKAAMAELFNLLDGNRTPITNLTIVYLFREFEKLGIANAVMRQWLHEKLRENLPDDLPDTNPVIF